MPRRWWTLVAVSLATFMTYLDNNVINVAIPTIQRSLHLSIAGLEWVVSSYILVFAGLLLAGGGVADLYGRRRLFLIGLSVFTLASLAAGLAGSGGVLIGARLLQGLGAAILVPTTLAVIVATFDDAAERTRAIGAWAAISALALACGPLIGGFISQHLHWGWIFFINVPIGVVTFVVAVLAMGESRTPAAVRRLDLPGLVASAVALFSLTYALIEGHDKGWTSYNGNVTDMSKEEVADFLEVLYASAVADLHGLTGPGVQLTALGESKVGGKPAVGVRVSSKDHRDISLYFDKATGLLLKKTLRRKEPGVPAEFTEETLYEDYKNVSGLMFPFHVSETRDGKPFWELILADAEVVEPRHVLVREQVGHRLKIELFFHSFRHQ